MILDIDGRGHFSSARDSASIANTLIAKKLGHPPPSCIPSSFQPCCFSLPHQFYWNSAKVGWEDVEHRRVFPSPGRREGAGRGNLSESIMCIFLLLWRTSIAAFLESTRSTKHSVILLGRMCHLDSHRPKPWIVIF